MTSLRISVGSAVLNLAGAHFTSDLLGGRENGTAWENCSMNTTDFTCYWPQSLAHLAKPYDDGVTDYLVIGQVTETPEAGFEGYRKLCVALVPPEALERVLNSKEATDWCVRANGPLPIVEPGRRHQAGFWLEGIKRTDRFEPLVHAWSASNHEVMLPDDSFLMVYGLVPRQLEDGLICWDDPHGPVYDVVRVRSHLDSHDKSLPASQVLVEVRRDYLYDYCHIKGCGAVAFFYEQRRSDGDQQFDVAIAGQENVDFNLPGRTLNLQDHSRDRETGHQFSQVWGRRLILAKGEPRVLDIDEPELDWPDYPGPMSLARACEEWAYAHINDSVLLDYQDRPEFNVYPVTGSVSYRGQWGVDFIHRYGRDYLRLEIKKLYEGAPPSVISHWHKFAVSKAVADAAIRASGERNIGLRAKEMVTAYLSLTRSLTELSDTLGLGFTQADVGVFTSEDVDYRGWWTIKGLAELGRIAPSEAPQSSYLDRAVDLSKMLEALKEAPLRNVLLKLGFDKSKIKDFKVLKLIATLCQLAVLVREGGHHWPTDGVSVVSSWDANVKHDFLKRLFALNELRILSAHRSGEDFARNLAEQSAAFEVEPAACVTGWGFAIDGLYDHLSADLTAIAALLKPGAVHVVPPNWP